MHDLYSNLQATDQVSRKGPSWEDTSIVTKHHSFQKPNPSCSSDKNLSTVWWGKSCWIAAEMCILSHHLTPCVHNHERFHNELIANYPVAQREGFSEIGRPCETFREKTDRQFAVVSVSKIIWGLRQRMQSKTAQCLFKYRNTVTICQAWSEKWSDPLATRWSSNIDRISIHVGDNSYSYFCSEIN